MFQISGSSLIALILPVLFCSVSGALPLLAGMYRGRTSVGWLASSVIVSAAITLGWPGALGTATLTSLVILTLTPISHTSDATAYAFNAVHSDLDQDAFDALDAVMVLGLT